MLSTRFMFYLLGIFITTIMLIVFLQYNSNSNINKLIHGNESLINEFEILGETERLQTDMLYIESEIHRAVIGEDSSYLRGIQDKEKNARARLLMLKSLVTTDSTRNLVAKLDSLIEEKLKFGNNVLSTLFSQGQPASEELYRSRKGKNAMGEIVNVIDALNGPRRLYLTQLAIDADKSGRDAKKWGIIMAATAVLACMFTFLYITKRIRRQQQLFDQLNESEKKVREAGIMKENFMANMSHEIRTPMNAILGFTHLLQKQPLNVKSQEFVDSIQKSGENLLTIINDVLDFSKIEAGMMRFESNPFSLRGLLHSVETMFTTRVQARNLKLTVNVENSIPDVLKGDAVRLTQILVNLVNNAVKFTNYGSIDLKLTIEDHTGTTIWINFSVKDTGIGIPPNKIETIFDRFQQADEKTTRKYGGTGLGLTIVKQLVELQNGKIMVNSVPEIGTEFIVVLPYQLTKQSVHKETNVSTSGHTLGEKQRNVRVLVAEDNMMNQSLMQHLLTEWNIDFHIVSNGQEAVDEVQRHQYNLVLMDIQMPQMDGYTAAQKIREGLNSTVPIVAMTAHAMAGEREKCLSYGMNEYISKPIRESELFAIIQNLLPKNESENAGEIKRTSHPGFETLNLDYLHELAGTNSSFEEKMLRQFLQQNPGELAVLQDAFDKSNYIEMAHIAHNIRTSVSFMGLLDIIGDELDYIEKKRDPGPDLTLLKKNISRVITICQKAIKETEAYLQTLA